MHNGEATVPGLIAIEGDNDFKHTIVRVNHIFAEHALLL